MSLLEVSVISLTGDFVQRHDWNTAGSDIGFVPVLQIGSQWIPAHSEIDVQRRNFDMFIGTILGVASHLQHR